MRILLSALSRLTIPSPVEFEIGINPCAKPLRFNPRKILVVNAYVSPSVSLETAFSNVFELVDHCSISASLVSITSVFVITFIVGKLSRNLIDVASNAIETKFVGVVTIAPSKRKILVFSSDLILSTIKRPLERYANNSI